jgi:hypothetical protein
VDGLSSEVAAHLPAIAEETLAELRTGEPPAGVQRATVELEAGPATLALRRRADGE